MTQCAQEVVAVSGKGPGNSASVLQSGTLVSAGLTLRDDSFACCLMHRRLEYCSSTTLLFSALFMARSLTRDQLNDFRVWLHSLNMDSLVKVAEVLDDLMADREMQQREAAAALQSQWQFVNPEPDLEQPSEAASSSSQRQPETS